MRTHNFVLSISWILMWQGIRIQQEEEIVNLELAIIL